MKDRLEDFVKEHRQAFDDLEPRATSWEAIAKEIPAARKKDFSWMWKAAAVVFLCLSVGLAVDRTMMDVGTSIAIQDGESSIPATELHEVETYYTQLISEKRSEIVNVINNKGLVDNELLEDIQQLDVMYGELKQDLENNQNDERLINAMIQNLQLRVEILNKQLRILEQISKHEEDAKISV